jgi:8-oxo-dGTP diphosphatase
MSWPIRVIRAAVGIIYHQEKILVAERPLGKPYSGYWEFPGGKIEANESGQEALIRELHEELGIHATDVRSCFEFTHAYPDKTVWLEVFLVSSYSGEPKNQENQILRWVSFGELSDLRILEGNLHILDRVKEIIFPQ